MSVTRPSVIIVLLAAAFLALGQSPWPAGADAPAPYGFVAKTPELSQPWYFRPYGLASDASDNIYLYDGRWSRVVKMSPAGEVLLAWGSDGTGPGQFSGYGRVAVGPSGNIYVTAGSRVQKFSPDGVYILEWSSAANRGIAVDGDEDVYLADGSGDRVQKFSSSGQFLTQWGTTGSGDGQFSLPYGVAVDASDNVYVVEYQNHRVQKFDSGGTFLAKWGTYGTADGQLAYPRGITADDAGNIYVADLVGNRVQKFTSDGIFLAKWYPHRSPGDLTVDSLGNTYVASSSDANQQENTQVEKFSAAGVRLAVWSAAGSGDGYFYYPVGVAVGPSGSIYIADQENDRVQKLSPTGTFVSKWYTPYPNSVAVDASENVYVGSSFGSYGIRKFTSAGQLLLSWGSAGAEDGQFGSSNGVGGIAIDGAGYVYAADLDNHRIQKFNSSGTFITKWGTSGPGDGQFSYPQGVAISPDDRLYVVDSGNRRIQVFGLDGNFISKWGSLGSGDGQFNGPNGIAITPAGTVLVGDYSNRIQTFDANGSFLAKFGSAGWLDGQFDYPRGMALDTQGNLRVADRGNHRVQTFCPIDAQTGSCQGSSPDADGDGVPDSTDNCLSTANPGQENNDGDAQGDACDPDDDNDTVADGADNCQYASNPSQSNADGDAEGDACDLDDDNDTVADGSDNCPLVANTGQANSVHPGTPAGDDCEDPEPDGVMDSTDNCPSDANAGQQNSIHAGTPAGDACEDPEPDGVMDAIDNCPDTANAGQQNSVHPGTPAGDACEDPDTDGVMDAADNCPDLANVTQQNTDGDSMGNACDADDDNDAIDDPVDSSPLTFSNVISDQPGGTTSGWINSRGGVTLRIRDAPNPKGVRVTVTGSGLPASLSFCFVNYTVGAGADFVVTCGSTHTEVLTGPLTAEFGPHTLTLATGTITTVTETPQGGYELANDPASTSSVTFGPVVIPPGGSDGDSDADSVFSSLETVCGSDPLAAASVPERLDGGFAAVDDDGDTQVDEPLPSGAETSDCDGDGYRGGPESGSPLCDGLNNDTNVYPLYPGPQVADDAIADDGCPGGPPPAGAFSEAGLKIGPTDQDPCGLDGWPSDFVTGGIPDSTNKVTITDLTSFLAPSRRLDTSPGHPSFSSRWDLVPGRGLFANWINISDLTALLAGPTGMPPMLGGAKAFGGPPCPWPG